MNNFENISDVKTVFEAAQKKGENFVYIVTDPDWIQDIKTMCDEKGWEDAVFVVAPPGADPEDIRYNMEMFRAFAEAKNRFVIMAIVLCESAYERATAEEILKSFRNIGPHAPLSQPFVAPGSDLVN